MLINIGGNQAVLPELAAQVWTSRYGLGVPDMRGMSRDLRNGRHGIVIERKRPTPNSNACMLVPGIM